MWAWIITARQSKKTGDTVMIDTANGVLGGNLSPLSNGYNASNRTTAQDGFTFSIISGTTNGTTAVTDYSTLPEGIWSGDVSVQFDATLDQLISLMYQQGYPPCFILGRNCYEKSTFCLSLCCFPEYHRPRRWMSAIYHRL